MAGGSEGAPEVEELGVWAPLLVEDDVLFEESSLKPHLAGQEKAGEQVRGHQNSLKPFVEKGRLRCATRPKRQDQGPATARFLSRCMETQTSWREG
jgi:hypothetical protein